METTIKHIEIKAIRYGGELAGAGELPPDYPPIIVEDMGHYYDLVDGYHRLGAAIDSGMTNIRAIIATAEDFARCREFGGDAESMTEAEWIRDMQERYA